MSLIRRYKTPSVSEAKKKDILAAAKKIISGSVVDMETEFCFYIDAASPLTAEESELLRWLLSETFEPDQYSESSFLANPQSPTPNGYFIEVGPRMSFTTAWSTNAVAICHSCGLTKIRRIERSRRYKIIWGQGFIDPRTLEPFISSLYDRMTECVYPEQLTTFDTGVKPAPVFFVPLVEEGRKALEKINREMGLGLDD